MSPDNILKRLRNGNTDILQDQREIARAVSARCKFLRKNKLRADVPLEPDWPVWFEFEHEIWRLGEDLRQLLQLRKKWRGRCDLLNEVAEIASCREFGKGRESFVMLLKYGHADYKACIRKLLKDKQVSGHAIHAANRGKIPGLSKQVLPFAESSKAWVRKEAKKYLVFDAATKPKERKV